MNADCRMLRDVICQPDSAMRAAARWLWVIALLACQLAHAQITVDNKTTAVSSASVSSLTWNHTVGSGSNGILIVGISFRDGNVSVTSVTYGGTALTRIGAQNSGGNQNRTEMWYLLAPASGTASVHISMSASKAVVATSISFFGVSQTTPLGTAAFASSGGSTTASVTVTSASGQVVIDTVTANGDARSLTAGASQTQQWNSYSGSGDASNARGAGSTQTAGATTTTMSWTLGASKPWSIGAVPLLPAPSAAGFNVVDGYFSSYPAATSGQRIYTKVAGTAFTLDVAALNSNSPTPGLVSPAYVSASGKITVDIVDDRDGTCASSCSGATCLAKSAVATQKTTFTASDNSYKTGLSFTLANAYPNLRVRVTDNSKSSAVYGCSVDNFSVRPTSLAVTSTANADSTGASATATPTVKAGASFTLTATAIAGYNGTPAISAASIAVNPSNAGTLSGSFGAANASNGAATGSFTYSEVGYFSLNTDAVNDQTFTAVDQSSDCTTDYSNTLVNGKYGCYFGNSAATAYFGRFIPDHFGVTTGTVTPACGTFTYYDQDGFITTFTLTAQNSSNATTRNYSGASFAKLGLTAWAGYVFTGDTATPSASATAPTGTWSNGAASVSAKHQVLARPTSAPASPVNLTVSTQPVDSDGVTMSAATAVMSAATPVRFGVLALGSAYGSDLLTLRLPVTAMYWNGTGLVANTADTCTGPALSNASIALGNQVQKPGTSGTFSTSAAASPTLASTWSQGAGSITLTAPSTAGTAQVALNLGSGSTDASCIGWSVASTGAQLPWLRGKWCGSSYSVDPSSLASFGTAATPFVFLRENH
jgi:MSHA biogenesis protein MshQ